MLMQRRKYVPKRIPDYWLKTPEERKAIRKQIAEYYEGQVKRFSCYETIKDDERFQGNRFLLFSTELFKDGVMRVSFLDWYFGYDNPADGIKDPPITLQFLKQSKFWKYSREEEHQRVIEEYFPIGNEEYYS